VVEVVHTDKWLNLGPLLNLLLAHTSDDSSRVTFNTSYQSMAIGLISGTVIVILQ